MIGEDIMPNNQLIKYNSNPISRFFNRIFSRFNSKSKTSVELDENIENLLQTEYSDEEKLNYSRELLKDFISRNANVLQTLNVKMLNKDLVEMFGKETLERIVTDEYLQGELSELSIEELQTYSYIIKYKATDINDRIANTSVYLNKNFKIQELENLGDKEKDKAISILLSDSAFKLSSLNELEQYYNNRKSICKQIIDSPKGLIDNFDYDAYFEENTDENTIPLELVENMKDLSEIDRTRYAIIEAKYGMSFEKAKMLCDAFGQDIKKVKSTEEKRIIQELISIFKENDIEKLKSINLDENYNNYIGTMNIVPNLKNTFLEMYKETLYQPKEDDYIGSQTVKIKGMKKSNVQIYNVLGKENNNADFNMILTSLGGIFPYGHDFSNFKSDWDRKDSNHTISCSYIGNDSLALTNDDLLLGFADINSNELIQARNMDAGTGDRPFYAINEYLNKNRFLSPETMTNSTKNYNEFFVERKIEENGHLSNRKPSYVVFMAENIDDINDKKNERWFRAKKMAAQLDIPIAIIDVTQCTKLEYQKTEEMVRLVKEEGRMDLIPQILHKIENNKSAQQGSLKNIRNKIFSEKNVNDLLEQIIGKIIISDTDTSNRGIEEFVKTIKSIKHIYEEQGDTYIKDCKSFNYDKYLERLKMLYTTRNGLDENGHIRGMERIDNNITQQKKNEQDR